VLKIVNAPTKRAIHAKMSRAIFRNPRSSSMSSVCCWAFSSPVRTSTLAGSAAATRRFSSSALTPASAAIEIVSNSPSLSARRWTSATGRIATVAPPNESTSPSFAIPTTSYLRAAWLPLTLMRSPSRTSSLSADSLSMATSSAVSGGLPSS
jgi:hypothetical protein